MEGVEVPPVNCPLNKVGYEQLKASINPMDASDSHGIDLYIKTLSFFQDCLEMNSNPMFACNDLVSVYD